MKRAIKFLAAAAIIFAVGAIAALLILRWMFPPEKIKAMALEKLRATIKREVRLGSVNIGLSGLDLKNLEISETPNFGAGTFVKVGTLRIRPKLKPLLKKRLEVADVLLSNWSCQIIKRRDGTFNFTSLTTPQTPAQPAPKAKSTPAQAAALAAAWSVGSLRFKQGNLSYEDGSSAISAKIAGIEASSQGLRPKGEFPLTLAMKLSGHAGKTLLGGTMNYRGTVDLGGLDPKKLSLRLSPLKLEYQGLKLEVKGDIQNAEAAALSLAISVPKQSENTWKALPLPSGIVPPALDVQLEAQQSGAAIKIKNLIVTAGASTGPGGVKLPPLSLQFSGTASSAQTVIEYCALKMGELQLSAHGQYLSPSNKPASVNISLETNVFALADVADLAPQAQNFHLQGKAALKLQASGALPSPALSGSAEIHDLGVEYQGQKLSLFNGALQFTPSAVSAQVSGKLNQSNLKVDVKAADYRTSPKVTLTGSLSELDLSHLPQTASSSSPPAANARTKKSSSPRALNPISSSGEFTIGKITHQNFSASQSKLQWNLNQLQAPEHLTGTAQFKIGEGKFDNLTSLSSGNALVHTALLPIIIIQKTAGFVKVPLFPSFDRVNFSEIVGNYAFQNGLMTITDSHMTADIANVQATGTADLARDELNLRVSARLANASEPIAFSVKGTMENPSVKLDVTSVLKQPGIQNAIQKGAEQLLRNLFK